MHSYSNAVTGLCIAVFVLFCFTFSPALGGAVINYFIPSCIGSQTELANLVYGKAQRTLPDSATFVCTGISTNLGSNTITWFYYENFPQTCDTSCCINTTTTTYTLTTSMGINFNGYNVINQEGSVTAGAFLGNSVFVTISNFVVNPFLCQLPVGLHARLGSYKLVIKDLAGHQILACEGSHTVEYCPGIH